MNGKSSKKKKRNSNVKYKEQKMSISKFTPGKMNLIPFLTIISILSIGTQ